MLDRLTVTKLPDARRAAKAEGGIEIIMTEGAVMMAFSFYLFKSVSDLKHVAVHPDGEHAKCFDFASWLEIQGFLKDQSVGGTAYGGLYRAADGRSIIINPKSGVGDVVADHNGQSFVAECKGGVLNSRHSGVVSRLRTGFCEIVGLSLAAPVVQNRRQFAVVPYTTGTLALARKLVTRASAAGVEIILIHRSGDIGLITAPVS